MCKKIISTVGLAFLLASVEIPPLYAGNNNPPSASRAALTVTTVRPLREQWPLTLTANGGLAAWQEAVIAAETGGLRITQIFVDVGTAVRRGQKLAQLAQDSVLADMEQQQAHVAQAKADLAQAKEDADRARNVEGRNVLTQQQSHQYLIAEQRAQAALDLAMAQLKSQQIRLDQTTIVAVDDGTISSRTATLGAVVQTGAELFRLVRQNRIEWRAELIADQAARVKPGQKVQVQLLGGETMEGTVRVVAPTVDPTTRNTLVYIDLPTVEAARPGVFVRGDILIGATETLTLPQSAVTLRDGYSYVFQVGADQTVTQRKISTGRRRADRVEITSGLNPDADVVQSGGAFLNDGDVVRIEARQNNVGQKAQ